MSSHASGQGMSQVTPVTARASVNVRSAISAIDAAWQTVTSYGAEIQSA